MEKKMYGAVYVPEIRKGGFSVEELAYAGAGVVKELAQDLLESQRLVASLKKELEAALGR